jgi:hypothetical protein
MPKSTKLKSMVQDAYNKSVLEKVEITQEDLMKLNVPISNYTIGNSTTELVDDIFNKTGANKEIILIALISIYFRSPGLKDNIVLKPRNYNSSTKEAPNLPQVMISFEEAVKTGLPITKEYNSSMASFFFYDEIGPNEVKAILEEIRHFPEIYNVMTQYLGNVETLTRYLIYLFYLKEVNIAKQLYTFATNQLLDVNEPTRTKNLIDLPTNYKLSLYNLYGTMNMETILATPPRPFEERIISLQDIQDKDLIQFAAEMGMIIPDRVNGKGIRKYILDFILDYQYIEKGKKELLLEQQPSGVAVMIDLLKTFTDFEIVEVFGYSGPFDNRRHLIEQCYMTFSNRGFTIRKSINRTKAINYKTGLGLDLDILPKPYLVFGTANSYQVLQLEDLVNIDYIITQNSKIMSREFPQDRGLTMFTTYQLDRLIELLPAIANMNEQLREMANIVLKHAIKGLQVRLTRVTATGEVNIPREGLHISPEIRKLLRYLEVTHASNVINIYENIYYLGLYLSGWDGPGNIFIHTPNYIKVSNTFNIRASLLRRKIVQQISSLDEELRELVISSQAVELNEKAQGLIIRSTPVTEVINTTNYDLIISTGKYYCAILGRSI